MTRARITIKFTLDLENDLANLNDSRSFNYAMTELDGAITNNTTKIIDYDVDLNSLQILED